MGKWGKEPCNLLNQREDARAYKGKDGWDSRPPAQAYVNLYNFYTIGFRCQKVFPAVLLGRWRKKILCKWLLYDGEETLKSWKPMLNTIFALRGSSECSVQPNAHNIFCAICQAAVPGRPFDTRITIGNYYKKYH